MADKDAPFKIETGIAVPPRASGGGGAPSPAALALAALKPDQSFLVPATLDPARKFKSKDEEAQALKDEQTKIANRMSGTIRRFRNNRPDSKAVFASRKVDGGVRVFRTS